MIELLGISGFKANSEALIRLKSLIRMGFLCKDVSIEEIISSIGTLLVLKKKFGPFSNTDFSCNLKVLDEKLIMPGPRVDEGITALFSDNFENFLSNLSLER